MDTFMEYFHIGSKLIVGLIGIVIVIRLLGKKEMSQVTLLDFVYALVLGGVIKDAMYDPAVTIPHMLFVLAMWGGLIFVFEKISQKSGIFRHVVKGRPVTLIREGRIVGRELERQNMEIEELDELLRMEGVFSVGEVNYAMLENSGKLSVLKKQIYQPVTKGHSEETQETDTPSYLLVSDGNINNLLLKDIGKDESWLKSSLQEMDLIYSDVYMAEWNTKTGWFIQESPGEDE